MSKFIFPLNALAYGESPLVRMEAIVSWCICKRGEELYNEDQAKCRDIAIAEWNNNKRGECCSNDDVWVKVWAGSSALNVKLGDYKYTLKKCKEIELFVDELKSGRTGMKTWIGSVLMWEFINAERSGDEPPISYHRLSALMAVNAALGGKSSPYILTRERINAMALGYGTVSALFGEDGKVHPEGLKLLKLRKDNAQPRTVRQIRLDLDFLEGNKFIYRLAVNRRHTAFFDANTVTRADALKWREARPCSVADRVSKLREEERKSSIGNAV